jgi:hypothetical protein
MRFGVLYLLEGLIFTILAADSCGTYGQRAKQIQLPFGTLAELIWVFIPVAFISVSIPAFRRKICRYQHWIHLYAVSCAIAPVFIFTQQSQKIPILDFPNREASAIFLERYDGRVLYVSTRGHKNAIIPRSLDSTEIARELYSLDPSLNPASAEHDVELKGLRP